MLARLVLSSALALPVAALAQAPQAGFFFGGALGQSTLKEWCDTGGVTTVTLTACEDSDSAWKVLGGYRFNRYVAVEASWIEWGEATATASNGARVAAEQYSYGLAVVGTLPLAERFELFGKAGFLFTEQETRRITPSPSTVERSESELHYGLGLRYALTRNWALRGEWERTEKLKVEMLSVGAEYRF